MAEPLVFKLVDFEMNDGYLSADTPERDPTNAEQAHCLCGRFAKYLGGRSYYNGTWDCYSFDVNCSRCGVVTVECV